MKFALALLAFVATSTAAPWILPNVGRGELAKELQDFLDLVPQEQITSITLQYYAQDPDFQAMIQYFKSEGFKQLVKDVEDLPETKSLLDYMYNAGIDVYKIEKMLNDLLNIALFNIDKQITGGIRGYVDDIEAAIAPVKDQIIALYYSKLQNSKVFQDFIEQLKSPNFKELAQKVYNHPKVKELLKHAKDNNIDLALIRKVLKDVLGLDFPDTFIF